MRPHVNVLVAAACAALICAPPARADRPDGWITTKVKVKLLSDEIVEGHDINVDTTDRRVTLQGRVENQAQKERAESLARTIEGVREVRNLLVIVPESQEKTARRSDRIVRQNVRTALANDPVLADDHVAVKSVNDGVVVLAGSVDSLYEHQRALKVAWGVPGVERVASEISSSNDEADMAIWRAGAMPEPAEPPKKARRSGNKVLHPDRWDPVITSRVKVKLLADDDVPGLDVNVDTDDGVVTLFGTVPTAEAKRQAEEIAAGVSGVASVRNELQVVAGEDRDGIAVDDGDAEDRVEERLDAEPALDGVDVDVEVDGGVARLSGTVRSEGQRLAAIVTARTTPGVRRVVDEMTIEQR